MTSTASSRLVETSLRLVTLASIAGLLFSDAHAATQPFTQNSAQLPEGEYPSPPSRCKVNQVIALQRNGASGPGAELATSIQDTLAKIVGKSEYSRSEMKFLSNYTYKLGASGALLAHGTTQLKDLGVQFRKTYCGTGSISEKDCTNVWVASTSSPSQVDSAKAWSTGFMQGTGTSSPSPRIIAEGAHDNNTLAANCPNLASSVPIAQQQWRDVWTPAVLQRLQGGTNYGLNSTDIVNFAYMCALESLVTTELSPFCGLFLDTEWSYVEYDGDLGKYYNHAYGAPLARSQGVGYANELLTRLSGLLAFYAQRDQTQVNNTADADPSKFPLDRSVYIDFTSDDQLLAVMTLLGLFL
ncbi:BZ3500_MvSof-1268-A1-R1_Chr8-1g09781 [Microbotryum saponariae]|uniref:BZ3500_MvSof-1268-A1-R1_Chr8-1g09781 protein n=1 Tax=Microbotryum saponariae TaxID=289078 RepID=A0A2X0KPL1_9BASI|nr:BZ3500_MvSof-1268-A1-R1_Chr8-1g09781 [Microbotryum saponariae]SDA08067.1 BZ3501_MvSof-1269-A2-R1_Chr8-1g09504 [Microbotryum saponariae]